MAPETVTLVGDGGSEFEFDLPLAPAFAAQVDAGQLRPVDGDVDTAIVLDEELAQADPVEEEPVEPDTEPDDDPVEDEPDEDNAGDPPPKVGAGSGTEAWAAYAQKLGIDTDGLKRAEIIAAVESK